LRRLPGVQNVRASSKTQRVEVLIDPAQVSVEQVRTKLQRLGFAVDAEGPPGE
jgi:copper chaperone CopZ